jgi:hypothetical protein
VAFFPNSSDRISTHSLNSSFIEIDRNNAIMTDVDSKNWVFLHLSKSNQFFFVCKKSSLIEVFVAINKKEIR